MLSYYLLNKNAYENTSTHRHFLYEFIKLVFYFYFSPAE
nr:MAG TPA: hypothetical protein [Caudoviricetes sp.]